MIITELIMCALTFIMSLGSGAFALILVYFHNSLFFVSSAIIIAISFGIFNGMFLDMLLRDIKIKSLEKKFLKHLQNAETITISDIK